MKPYMLQGHERPITMVKYNREGDLLFSTAKDMVPTVWYADNGERVGTYDGHQGAVWAVDVKWDSSQIATCSADQTARLWDTQTGRELHSFMCDGPVRMVDYSEGDKMLLCVVDWFNQNPATVVAFDVSSGNFSNEPIFEIPFEERATRPTGAYWLPLNKGIVITCADGSVKTFDTKTLNMLNEVKVHKKNINVFQYNKEKTLAITGSADTTAKLLDVETWETLKSFDTDRPVNAAAISPLKCHVIVGGGQEAMDVTTTSSKAGKFEARFFHMIYGDEFGVVKGHFGPINSIAINPDGRSYASGAEDGYVRLHHFDPDYYEKHREDDDILDEEDEEEDDE